MKWVSVNERLPNHSNPIPVKYPSIGWGFVVAFWSPIYQRWVLEWPNLQFYSNAVTEWLDFEGQDV